MIGEVVLGLREYELTKRAEPGSSVGDLDVEEDGNRDQGWRRCLVLLWPAKP